MSQERREDSRRKVYRGEGFYAILHWRGGRLRCDTIDICQFGMGLVNCVGELIPELPEVGEKVHVRILQKGAGVLFEIPSRLCTIQNTTIQGLKLKRFGVSFLKRRLPVLYNSELHSQIQKDHYIRCRKFLYPIAYAKDPFFFSESVHFQIAGIRSDGFLMVTSSRNKSLIPNVPVDLVLFLPLYGEIRCRATIKGLYRSKSKTRTLCSCIIQTISKADEEKLPLYLLSTKTISNPEELKKAGFRHGQLHQAVITRYANGKEDFKRARNLYFQHYEDEELEFDGELISKRARLLMCELGKELVAACQIIFVDGEPTYSFYSQKAGKLPDFLWESKFVEVDAFAWSHHVKLQDTFLNLVHHVTRIAAETHQKFLLWSCGKELWPVFKKIGFERLNIHFDQVIHGMRVEKELIILNVEKRLEGRGKIDPKTWATVFKPIVEYIGQR